MDSAKASVVKKYKNVRRSLSSLILGDTPVLNLERRYAGREFRLTEAQVLTNGAQFGGEMFWFYRLTRSHLRHC